MSTNQKAAEPFELASVVSAIVKRIDGDIDGAGVAQFARFLAQYPRPAPPGSVPAPVRRWQDTIIATEIPSRSSVLDLGCGTGELLETLMVQKGVRVQGIEFDAQAVIECVERGVPVLQMDLDEGLKGFSDGGFDYVVLEETLQTLHRPLTLLEEMLRVGKHGIVSFPNFAYWRIRLAIAVQGRMPVTDRLSHAWYDTPNIHHLSMRDFLDWTLVTGVRVSKAFVLAEGEVRPLQEDDNLYAEEALFFVSRNGD